VKKFIINDRIKAYRVKLILPNGENKGEMLKSAAIDIARQEGLDLVEMSNETVPVCKIMDYGKLMYDQSKAEKSQKHTPSLKQIIVKYNTGDHDLEIKRKKTIELLEEGHKVSFSIELKGREKFITGNPGKEKFDKIITNYFSEYEKSEVFTGGSGYKITISPTKVLKKQ